MLVRKSENHVVKKPKKQKPDPWIERLNYGIRLRLFDSLIRLLASPMELRVVFTLARPLISPERIIPFASAVGIFNGFILNISSSNEVKLRLNLKERRGIRNPKHLNGNMIL